MYLPQCLMRKEEYMLFLQGLKHVDDETVYDELKAIEKKYANDDFLIIREQLDFRDLPETYSKEIENILDFFRFVSESYKDHDEDAGIRHEKISFEVEDHHYLIDAPGYEYLVRLQKEGFNPEIRLYKYLFEHQKEYRDTTDKYVLSRRGEFESWEELTKHVVNSLDVKLFRQTMRWREDSILKQVLQLLKKNGKFKAALFYGQYHIPGFVSILESKGWEIVEKDNLKPRE